MSHARRLLPLLALGAAYPLLTGFVLLSGHDAKLPVTAESPTLTFIWDGKSPPITGKDKFKSGKYEGEDDADYMESLLNEAMGIWNDVPGAYVKLAVTQGDAADDSTDRQFSILTLKNANLSTAAYASPTFDPDDKSTIYDCDVHLSSSSVDASDLAFTIAHELGHCLGLGHAHTNYQAIMGYSRTSKTLELGADDKAGVIYLYPDPAVWDGKTKELVCGVVSGAGGTGGAAAPGAPLLALLLLLPLATAATRSARGGLSRARAAGARRLRRRA